MESIALYCAMAHFLLLLHAIVVMTKFYAVVLYHNTNACNRLLKLDLGRHV
jgi:hypothetical protein